MISSDAKMFYIKAISNYLFANKYEYLDKTIQKIANDNAIAWEYMPSQRPIFKYKGKEYWNDVFVWTNSWFPRLDLHPSLENRMDNYLLERTSLNQDKVKILAYLKRILNLAQDNYEVRLLSSTKLEELLPLTDNRKIIPTEKSIQFRKENIEAEKAVANRIMKNLLLKDK